MKHTFSRPAVWLLIQPLLLLVLLGFRGSLQPQIVPDTASYEQFDWSTVTGVLGGIRTVGYPLFLATASLLDDGYQMVPALHFLAQTIAVWILYWGMRKTSVRPWAAALAASTLFYGHSVTTLMSIVFADPLAISCAIAAAGFLLAVAAERTSKTGWCGLALTTFFVYQIQPAYLFVIILWPVLGWFLMRCVIRSPLTARQRCAFGTCLLATVVLPFLLFCGLRWVLLGHFGLVSFGGYNIVGIAGQLVEANDVPHLPESLRPLAQEFVHGQPPDSGWNSYRDSFLVMEQQYNLIIWEIGVPAAKRLYADDPVLVNRRLTEFSRAVLRRHWREYGRWLLANTKHGLLQMIVLLAKDRAMITLLIMLLVIHAWRAAGGSLGAPLALADSTIRFRETQVLIWLALGFAGAKLMLVVLVEPANDRYMKGAMAFFPAALALMAAQSLIPPTRRSQLTPQKPRAA